MPKGIALWKMNLIDNRLNTNKPISTALSKFEYCYELGIVGIGWGRGYAPSEKRNFEYAKDKLSAMNIGDLVLTKNPDTNEYYVCKITGEYVNADTKINDTYDVNIFRKCIFYKIDNTELLSVFNGHQLSARKTICESKITELNNLIFEMLNQVK